MASGKIKQTVETTYRSKGAKKGVKDAETMGRAQTRMGQASASTGRQFSAQASGLGGLVAAYAGAAANVFALQQAFAALTRAAQAEQIVKGTRTLALAIAQSGETILKNIKEITQGQLSLEESAKSANIALSAGFNTEQISRLTKVSMQASRALGRTLTDAFTRVTRGAAKLEPELLDELGIFTRIDPAVQKYADRLNVAASSLTNFERRQAFVTAVIEEGEAKFSSIDTTAESTQASIERLVVQLTDLAHGFGQAIATGLKPFIDFLSYNAGNSMLLFGGILTLVFGKAGALIGGFVKNALKDLGRFSEFLADKSKFDVAALSGLKQRGGMKVGEGGFMGMRTAARFGQDTEQAGRFKSAVGVIQKGDIQTVSELNKVNNALKEQKRYWDSVGKTGSKSYEIINQEIKNNNALLEKSGWRIRSLTKFTNLLNTSIRWLAAGFRLLGKAINAAFLIIGALQLVGTLFDKDYLGDLVNWFKDLTQALKDFKAGAKGIIIAQGGGTEAIAERLKFLGIDPDDEKTKEKIKDFTESVYSDLMKAMEVEQKKLVGTSTWTLPLLDRSVGLQKAIRDTQEPAARKAIENREREINKKITAERNKAPQDQNMQELENLRIQLALIENLSGAFAKLVGVEKLVGQSARVIGASTADTAVVMKDMIKTVVGNNRQIAIMGITMKTAGNLASELAYNIETLNDEERDAIYTALGLGLALKESNAAFQRGSIDANKMSSVLINAKNAIKILVAAEEELSEVDTFQLGMYNQQISVLRKQVAEWEELTKVAKKYDTFLKGFRQTLSSVIKAMDTAFLKGGIDESGMVAEDKVEQERNYLHLLMKSSELLNLNGEREALLLKHKNSLKDESIELTKAELDTLEKIRLADKGIAAEMTRLIPIIQKIIKAEEKRKFMLDQQNKLLREQAKVQDAQANAKFAQTSQQITNRLLDKTFVYGKKINELYKTRLDYMDKVTNYVKEHFKHEERLTNLQLARQKRADKRKFDRAQFDLEMKLMKEQFKLQEMERFPGLYTTDDTIEKRKQIIDLEYDMQMNIIRHKEAAAWSEFKAQWKTLTTKLLIAKDEQKDLAKREVLEKQMRKNEWMLFAAETKYGRLKLKQEETRIQHEQNIIVAQGNLDLARIKSDEEKRAFERKTLRVQVENYKFFADVVSHLSKAMGPNSAFVKTVEQYLLHEYQVKKLNRGKTVSDQYIAKTDRLERAMGEVDTAAGEGFKARRKAVTERVGAGFEDTTDRIAALENIRKMQEHITTIDVLIRINQDQMKNVENDRRKEELEYRIKELTQKKQANHDILMDSLATYERDREATGSLRDFKKRVAEQERDYVRQFGDEVSTAFAGDLKGAFTNFFNSVKEGKGILESAKDAWNSFVMKIIDSLQEKVTDKFIAPVLEKGMDSLFGSIFNAAGGPVHMAGGGAMRRDRVPAMLEPGEFVIRKPMAKAIGGPALHAMNGTGKGLTPNIEVVVNNQGTPKDAQANVKPQIDVDKMVVEIVTRDIRNNGPIRKTLRAGGSS